MFGQHFYHKQIRNAVIAFGTIFNNINIKRTDSTEILYRQLECLYHMHQKKNLLQG